METVELEATIEEPGEYTVSINEGKLEPSLIVEEAETSTADAADSTNSDTETDSDSTFEQAE